MRIVSASHKDLQALVDQEVFRQDLYFRLNVIQVCVPRLAERPEDIPLLTRHFIRKYAQEWGMPEVDLSPRAADALQQYSFPGNVRELENILQRAFTMAEGELISIDDLSLSEQSPSMTQSHHNSVELTIETNNLEAYLENIERLAITQALEATRWNKTAAAEKLGISFRALRYRCKKLAID